jgi:plasmid stabilization system protein ParE
MLIHPEADAEIKAASSNYEALQVGLGHAFLDEVADAFDQIQQHPLAWAILTDHLRRRLLHRFPYGVVYQIEADQIFVVAVMHLHRQPDYWRSRLQH